MNTKYLVIWQDIPHDDYVDYLGWTRSQEAGKFATLKSAMVFAEDKSRIYDEVYIVEAKPYLKIERAPAIVKDMK
jgi:hypothetical protein